jgi:hypothetical protein
LKEFSDKNSRSAREPGTVATLAILPFSENDSASPFVYSLAASKHSTLPF